MVEKVLRSCGLEGTIWFRRSGIYNISISIDQGSFFWSWRRSGDLRLGCYQSFENLYIYIYTYTLYVYIINMASSSIFGEYSDLFPTRDLKVGCRSAGGPGCGERGHYCGWIWGWCKTRNPSHFELQQGTRRLIHIIIIMYVYYITLCFILFYYILSYYIILVIVIYYILI